MSQIGLRVVNVEHKSSSQDIGPGSDYWKSLLLDSQVSTYQTGVRSFGYEPIGTLYDVTKKVNLRPYTATPVEERKYTKPSDKACPACKKKGAAPAPHRIVVSKETEGPDVVEVECSDGRVVTDPGGKLYANLRESDETPDEFRLRVRADIAANPEKYYQRGFVVRLAQEEKDAAADAWEVARQIRDSQLEKRWPRNPEACKAFNSYCQYWAVCTGEATIDDPLRYRDADMHEELEASPKDGKRRLPLVTVSSMRSYRSCARRYYFAYELRRRSVADADALRFGTVFHAGLEVWWQTVDLDASLAAMRALYRVQTIEHVDAIKVEELMCGYHVRWQNEPLNVLRVEAEFRAPLINPKTDAASKTWELGGKIDAIVEAPPSASAAA